MKTEKGLFVVTSFEVTDNVLNAARTSKRPLVRVNLSFGGAVSDEEKALLNGLPAEEQAAIVADLQRLKATRYTQLVTLDDVGVPYTPAPAGDASLWEYYTPAVAAVLAAKKHYICTAYTASIPELLEGTPMAYGVGKDGQPVQITGVKDAETGRIYATHSRVYFGLHSDEATALQTLRNGLIRDISEGDSILGANDTETEAFARKLANATAAATA